MIDRMQAGVDPLMWAAMSLNKGEQFYLSTKNIMFEVALEA